jgi:GT2 family glycosyltransferase
VTDDIQTPSPDTPPGSANGPTSHGLVSVVIPAFNRVHVVLRAIRSALAQSYGDLEVIVVDDGSTDGTRDAIAGLDDDRLHYVWQENAGLPAARNRGIAESSGDFIALLDSDDVWLPWKVEAQLAALAAFPASGMVWTNMVAVNEAGTVLNERYLTTMYTAYRYLDRERDFAERRLLGRIWPGCPTDLARTRCWAGDVYSSMFMGNLAHDSTVLLTRERQQAIGVFDLAFEPGYEYFLRACRQGEVVFVDAPSIRYQIGAEDQMSAPGRLVVAARSNLATVEKALVDDAGVDRVPDRMIRERLALCHAWLGREEFFADRRSARRHLRIAFGSGPLTYRGAQWHAFAWWVLSFFPDRVAQSLRDARGMSPFLAKLARRRGAKRRSSS